jgi:IMP dehydrogenase
VTYALENARKGYSLDDIMLEPRYSALKSRRDVSLETPIGKKTWLKYPFIASPMNSVTNATVASKISEVGGIAYTHRYQDVVAQLGDCMIGGRYGGAGAGINLDPKRAAVLIDNGVKRLMMDVASGWTKKAMEFMRDLKRDYPDIELISGNITSVEALAAMNDLEIDAVRVGIGAGSVCTTRLVAGVGVPTATCLDDLYNKKIRDDMPIRLLQDGGIRNTGDIVKCLALGADAVIIGRLFSQTEEAIGSDDIIMQDGQRMKRYSGMASRQALLQRKQDEADYEGSIHLEMPEGKAELVPIVGPIEDLLRELIAGTQIGLSYVGARNLGELRDKARIFIKA